MKGGMKYAVLAVDKKGRIHVPRELRDELGLGSQVMMERERGVLVMKPLRKIDDPIAYLASINVKTKATPLEMKREAEGGF